MVTDADDDELRNAWARVRTTIHQINGHWWNRRKRPEASDLHLLLETVAAYTRAALAAVKLEGVGEL